jgi:hypothetical protein
MIQWKPLNVVQRETSHINQMKTIRKSPIHKKYCIDSYMELRQTESI